MTPIMQTVLAVAVCAGLLLLAFGLDRLARWLYPPWGERDED